MNLQERIDLLQRLGQYLLSDDAEWIQAKERAAAENTWFTPSFIDKAVNHIAVHFLNSNILAEWTTGYRLPGVNAHPRSVGIVMAGNIPLVGFHDLLCVFITGHRAVIKPSSKDQVLIRHLVNKLAGWNAEVKEMIRFADILKGKDAYIATGSNNSAAHFEYYFRKYPHIIRRNRTSVAILTGSETRQELELLADDVYMYFGLGCRNVTKIYVPQGYDFVPLLNAFRKFNYLADHHKYKNNYDYNLALHILNKKFYMSNDSLLLVEEPGLFSPISQLNYEFYEDIEEVKTSMKEKEAELQCITGPGFLPLGTAQQPSVSDYADGVDTLRFLQQLE